MSVVVSLRIKGSNAIAMLSKLIMLPPKTTNMDSLNSRRGLHESAYDKNVEQDMAPKVVADNVVQPDSDKYWAPHPETGVFGPETDVDPTTFQAPSNGNGTEDSVLEQQAFIRPQEDLEIPEQEFDNPIEP